MGRKSREKRERRERRNRTNGRNLCSRNRLAARGTDRIERLESALRDLSDGEFVSSHGPGTSVEEREAYLQNVLAFESVNEGISLFQGLQKHGLELPRPETLTDRECAEKSMEIAQALMVRQRVFLIGFQHMSPRELYTTLWNETLWEGCYLEGRDPAFVTAIDVSHQMSRSEVMACMRELQRAATVH
jgi:hypothetical protein